MLIIALLILRALRDLFTAHLLNPPDCFKVSTGKPMWFFSECKVTNWTSDMVTW
jgi:hypothetical protein